MRLGKKTVSEIQQNPKLTLFFFSAAVAGAIAGTLARQG
jgi:hypothetical protein